MKTTYTLNDTLNLRELIETITDHVRTNSATETQPRTILSFLNTLLSGLNLIGGSADSWILTLQKILSGNISYTKEDSLAKQICSGELDEPLIANLSFITSVISALPGEDLFYVKLQQRVSLRFFSIQEKDYLQEQLQNKNYSTYLLALLKHSFTRL